ncbi:DUF1932 domain-containing protein [Streptosporangium sp. NBC_01810]|uniref:DUF1932 domain-containing protein n=1 Tax=Streptosporangium sp. NBC_01810 TaxID=2975951 RepID=UPI002DDB7078|nr:DUF1932 domain-containing protein [Streptosporangium sp. NBC_01810]WSA25910.1 DUF1932 domain-containing protein [Streptosporangium sp. NBC_01810]
MTEPPLTIAILHPGRMGAALATVLTAPERRLLCCLEGRSEATRQRAHDGGLISVPMRQLANEADIALSIVEPAVAYPVAMDLVTAGFHGLLIEANAIRPQALRAIADRVHAGGGQVVDASIMGPPPARNLPQPTRLYLSGPTSGVDVATTLFTAQELRTTVLGEDLGQASALKLAHSTVHKAGRALALLGHALAQEHGLSSELAEEMSRWSHPASNPEQFPSVASRSWRWGDELREAAEELHDSGLPSELVVHAAALFDLLADFKGASPTLEEIFNALNRRPTAS